MSAAQPNQTRPPCRTCRGAGSITVKAHTKDGVKETAAPCPACRGTKVAGYVTK